MGVVFFSVLDSLSDHSIVILTVSVPFKYHYHHTYIFKNVFACLKPLVRYFLYH